MTEHGMVLAYGDQEASPMTQQSPNATHMSFVLHYLHLPCCFNIKLNEDDNKFIGWPLSRWNCICIGCIITLPYTYFNAHHHPVWRWKRTLLFLTAYSLLNIKYLCQNEFMLQLLNRIDD